MPESIKIAIAVILIALIGSDLGLNVTMAFAFETAGSAHAVGKADCLAWGCFVPHGAMDWTAFATLLLFLATVALASATFYLVKTAQTELSNTRDESILSRIEDRRIRTVAACVRYETATIARSVEALRGVNAGLPFLPNQHAHHVNIILNYLDTIAICIRQGVYDEDIAKDHLQNIVKKQCGLYLNPQIVGQIGSSMAQFPDLDLLYRRWS